MVGGDVRPRERGARLRDIGGSSWAGSHKLAGGSPAGEFLDPLANEFKAPNMISPVSDNSKPFQTLYNKNLNTQNDVMKRLASGRRINSGKDDPAGLIAATRLEAAIASLEAESRAIQRTNANANIADGHLSQLSEMSADLQGLVVAGANTAGNRFFWIDGNFLTPIFHVEKFFDKRPSFVLQEQPDTTVQIVDVWWNLFLNSALRQGIVSPGA